MLYNLRHISLATCSYSLLLICLLKLIDLTASRPHAEWVRNHVGSNDDALLRRSALRLEHRRIANVSTTAARPRVMLGTTSFSKKSLYFSGTRKLRKQHLTEYFAQGYLILRDLLPPETVIVVRKHLNLSCRVGEGRTNPWMQNRALLDFMYFGPFGEIASQLFGGADAHLLRSTSYAQVEQPGGEDKPTPEYHFDWAENGGRFTPASFTKQSLIKFYVALYDNMPAMWIINQTSLERWLKGLPHSLGEDPIHLYHMYRNGILPPPTDTCDEHVCKSFVPAIPKPLFDDLAIKAKLRLGDVIVHATTILHRSAGHSKLGRKRGVLTLTYARPDTVYYGFKGMTYNSHECDSGLRDSHIGHRPSISEVPHSDCFPRVYPRTDVRGRARLLKVWPRR